MRETDFHPELIGRDKEIGQIETYLADAHDGRGSTLFIVGEAGIGKTRLSNELKILAENRDFQILSGECMYESLTPYMPFREALSSEGMENLFAKETPRVEGVYLVTDTGLLIKEVLRQETDLDPDIFASMLTTVRGFVRDSLAMLSGEEKEGALNSLEYENHQILIESGRNTNLVAIISGRKNEFLINDMRDILVDVDRSFGGVLKKWDGNDKTVKGIEGLLKPLITSGKYDGISYGAEDPKTQRNMMFENVSLGLIRQSRMKPTLICIEDLQWADPSTLAMMHYIARNTKKCNLMILGTYRPEDVVAKEGRPHPLIEMMQLMNREDLYGKIELQRLSESSISEILSSLFGEVEFSEEFKNRLFTETEGNPLFIIELMKMIVEEGALRLEDGSWKLTAQLDEIDVPSKIYDVIVRRLNRIDEEHREVLDCASAIGEEFTSDVLSSTLKKGKMQLLKVLRILEQKHKLIRSGRDNYRFDHVKIKEVLYSEIPVELRREYHLIIAEVLEDMNRSDIDSAADNIAFHYSRSSRREMALPYHIKAAERAASSYAQDAAYDNYRWALDIIDSMEDSLHNKHQKLQILMALGECGYINGDWDDALNYYGQAVTLSQEIGDSGSKTKTAKAFKNIGLIHINRNEWDDALVNLEKGLRVSEEIGDRLRVAEIYYDLGTVFERKGELPKAGRYYDRCMDIAVNINDSSEIVDAYLGIGRLHAQKSEYDESIEAFKNAVKILKENQDFAELSRVYASLGATYIFLDLDEAIRYHNKAIETADRTRNIRIKGYGYMNIAYALIKKGELTDASSYLDKAVDIFEKIGERMSISTAYTNYGTIYRLQKEWDRAEHYFEKAIEISTELNIPYNLGYAMFEYGLMCKNMGNMEGASYRFEKALEIFKELQNAKMIEKVEIVLGS